MSPTSALEEDEIDPGAEEDPNNLLTKLKRVSEDELSSDKSSESVIWLTVGRNTEEEKEEAEVSHSEATCKVSHREFCIRKTQTAHRRAAQTQSPVRYRFRLDKKIPDRRVK